MFCFSFGGLTSDDQETSTVLRGERGPEVSPKSRRSLTKRAAKAEDHAQPWMHGMLGRHSAGKGASGIGGRPSGHC